VAVADIDSARARQLAAQFSGCVAGGDWESVIRRPDVDIVIVATTNNMLAPITTAAVRQGKHVLVEKPAARNAAELRPLVAAARQAGVVTKVGFNHRFHPAFAKARAIVDAGELGRLMYIRARYGHGGRSWAAVAVAGADIHQAAGLRPRMAGRPRDRRRRRAAGSRRSPR
jgi:predicted dehydrogenase